MAAQPTPGLAARLLALRLIERIDEEGTWSVSYTHLTLPTS